MGHQDCFHLLYLLLPQWSYVIFTSLTSTVFISSLTFESFLPLSFCFSSYLFYFFFLFHLLSLWFSSHFLQSPHHGLYYLQSAKKNFKSVFPSLDFVMISSSSFSAVYFQCLLCFVLLHFCCECFRLYLLYFIDASHIISV